MLRAVSGRSISYPRTKTLAAVTPDEDAAYPI